jgi:elongation factor Ts
MTFTMEQVKELRTRTGCGIVDCKEALQETDGDITQAITSLRKRGKAQAAKKAERDTREGVVASYVHSNNKIAVLVSLLCETDFVARNEKFQELAHDIAIHVAAMEPVSVSPEDISEEVMAEEKTVALDQAEKSGKPKEIQEKMIEGKLNKFRTERALLTQSFVKDPNKTIEDIISEAVGELGENISVGEFTRLSI